MRDPDQFKLVRAEPRPGRILCLGRCGKLFDSPDRVNIRFCSRCKGGSAWKGSSGSDAALPAGGTISAAVVQPTNKTPGPNGPQPQMRASMARKAQREGAANRAARKEDP